MKTIVAAHTGFCFGVKRALGIAQKTLASHPHVYIKGDLVHNEEVCRKLERRGLKKVLSFSQIPQGCKLIIKAHGESLAMYRKIEKKKLHIVDATCPMVKDIHKKAKSLQRKGYQVVIIGDRTHEETIGILGHVSSGLVLETAKDVAAIKSKLAKKVGVVCQSTQNRENVAQILGALTRNTEELLFLNTICHPTRLRQQEIERLALRYQAVLIVGSMHSANTKRLYEVAKTFNKNVFWVDSADKVSRVRFKRFRSLGIIGGASTPQEVLQEIQRKLS